MRNTQAQSSPAVRFMPSMKNDRAPASRMTAVFLFGLTQAAAVQPRALFGGHLGGAFIGIACYQLFGDAPWVYVLSVAVTVVALLATRAVHPPAGANPP